VHKVKEDQEMSDPTTLYASGEEAINRVIQLEDNDSPRCSTVEEYEEYYELKRTAEKINEGQYKRV
jgi:hypothetical protein